MDNTEHYLAVAAAVFAFGKGIGEFYLQSRMVEFRRFGRAVKMAATFGAGLFALNAVLDIQAVTKHGTSGIFIFTGGLMLYIVMMMYRLEKRGKLKEPE